jgi:hypothetical protein
MITGSIAGNNPVQTLELNARMNQAPPAGQVYEAWLVDKDSDYRQSLGAFMGDTISVRQTLPNLSGYGSVAVSLQPVSSAVPASATIVAQGNLPGTMVSAANFSTMAVLPDNETFQRQIVMQRFNLTNDQVNNLRMMGYSYSDISQIANVASRCNKSMTDIANMLSAGQSWQDIATSCNTTTAMLFNPIPMEAVAGYTGEIGAISTTAPIYYRTYPNGRPVVDTATWNMLHKMGYSWREVAVAANISAQTGEPVQDILRMTSIQGKTFAQIAMERGLDTRDIMNVSTWPFGESEVTATTMPSTTMTTPMPQEEPEGTGY